MLQKAQAALPKLMTALCVTTSVMLVGCGSDGSSDDEASTAYFMFYNGASNAPELTLGLEDDEGELREIPGIAYGNAVGLYSFEAGDYDLSLGVSISSSREATVYQQPETLPVDQISFLVAAGDIETPVIFNYQFDYEEFEPEDEEDEVDYFSLRAINVEDQQRPVDIYFGLADKEFSDAELLTSLTYGAMSNVQTFDLEEYRVYLTESGSDEVLFESDAIPMLYITQQILVVKSLPENIGGGFVVDVLNGWGGEDEYHNIHAGARAQFYNAMDENTLLPEYDGEVDIFLGGIDDTPNIDALARSALAPVEQYDAGDYSLDLLSSAGDKIANSQILSLAANSDKTVFFYLTEVALQDDDEADEELELYVNSLITDNNPIVGKYHHEVKVVNFVEDYAAITVYFVPTGETLSTTPFKLTNTRGLASTYELYNDDYDVFVVAKENGTEYLLSSTSLTLEETTGNLFLVVEQEDADVDDFSINIFSQ